MIDNGTETAKKKTHPAKQHISGIIIPGWWRKTYVLPICIGAGASIIFSVSVLLSAGDRITQSHDDAPQEAIVEPKLDVTNKLDVTENDHYFEVTPYEEPLPSEPYDEKLLQLDATGPRIEVAEEYIPQVVYESEQSLDTKTASAVDVLNSQKSRQNTTPLAPTIFKNLLNEESWQQYAVNITYPIGAPIIAIVLDDMGVDIRRSNRALELPAPITMSYMTYANDVPGQAARASQAGHELMLHVPMEPTSPTIDPGPNALRIDDDADEILRRLRWGLSQYKGYVGINNHMGSRFTQNEAGMRTVLNEVKNRELIFLDSRTSGASVARSLANEIGLTFVSRNVFLDHTDNEADIWAQLYETERLARKNGAVIAIGHPREATLDVLEQWITTIADKGFTLVPLSAVVKRKYAAN